MQGHILVITTALLRKEALASSLLFWKGGLVVLQTILERSQERLANLEEERLKPKGAFKGARGAKANKAAANEKIVAGVVQAELVLLAAVSRLLEATIELTPFQSSELTVGVERVESASGRSKHNAKR
jgi:hypothetical protein